MLFSIESTCAQLSVQKTLRGLLVFKIPEQQLQLFILCNDNTLTWIATLNLGADKLQAKYHDVTHWLTSVNVLYIAGMVRVRETVDR